MKRNKIKDKYLSKISNPIDNQEGVWEKVQNNHLDITHKILNLCKSIGLILLLLYWSSIPIIILMSFGIDYTKFSFIAKIIYMVMCDVIFLLFIMYIYRKDIIRDFKNFFNKDFLKNIGIALTYWLIGVSIMIFSNFIIYYITHGGMAANEESVRELINKAPIYMLFDVAIYAPITEELIFRRSFKDFIEQKYVYIFVSGLVFGGLHIISSLENITGLLYLIPYGTLGICFAALYKRTDNIFSTISMHALHNSISFAILISSTIF